MKCAASSYSEAWPSDTKSVAALAFHIAGKDGQYVLAVSFVTLPNPPPPSLTLTAAFWLAGRRVIFIVTVTETFWIREPSPFLSIPKTSHNAYYVKLNKAG